MHPDKMLSTSLYLLTNRIPSVEQFAVSLGTIIIIWLAFILSEARKLPLKPTRLECRWLWVHLLPSTTLYSFAKLANHSKDPAMVWFIALLVFRYYKTVVGIFFWFRYKLALQVSTPKYMSHHCTVIVPTVGPAGNGSFKEMVWGILANSPGRVIFSTNTEAAMKDVKEALGKIISEFKAGKTKYQSECNLNRPWANFSVDVINSAVSNKRLQTIQGAANVTTDLIAMVDDTAIWSPDFLTATLPAFQDQKVAVVGTRKWVKLLPWTNDPQKSTVANWVNNYQTRFWNTLGALYLIRHNFEIRSSNSADGGVFCVSGRSALIRTQILLDKAFQKGFLEEYVIDCFGYRLGHLRADDDNFITRWIERHGWKVKIQYSEDATITTTLGNPDKFLDQCLRWSRTTIRQNIKALFGDRSIWWRWPISVWTTHLPWLWNAALLWDSAMVYRLTQTNWYRKSENQRWVMTGLLTLIYATKPIKVFPWFWAHPQCFFLYFFPIPATPLFSYFHSLLKLWTYFTALVRYHMGR